LVIIEKLKVAIYNLLACCLDFNISSRQFQWTIRVSRIRSVKKSVWTILITMILVCVTSCIKNQAQENQYTENLEQITIITPEIIKSNYIPDGSIIVSNLDKGGSGKYEFSPSEFEFKVGDEVTFALTSETEFHTFTISELDIDVEIESGQTEIFTFDFDKPGEYRIFCIPHESLGMVGEIIVE